MKNSKDINAFYDGMTEGVCMYAHWKDGVQYVGTTGRTLQSALANIEQLRQQALNNLKD